MSKEISEANLIKSLVFLGLATYMIGSCARPRQASEPVKPTFEPTAPKFLTPTTMPSLLPTIKSGDRLVKFEIFPPHPTPTPDLSLIDTSKAVRY